MITATDIELRAGTRILLSGATLRVETTLVQIPVSITDSANRFVLGLQKQDFHLFEDGVEQEIAHFSDEEAPLCRG